MTIEVFDQVGNLRGWVAYPPVELLSSRYVSYLAESRLSRHTRLTRSLRGAVLEKASIPKVTLAIEEWANAGAQPRVVLVAKPADLRVLEASDTFTRFQP